MAAIHKYLTHSALPSLSARICCREVISIAPKPLVASKVGVFAAYADSDPSNLGLLSVSVAGKNNLNFQKKLESFSIDIGEHTSGSMPADELYGAILMVAQCEAQPPKTEVVEAIERVFGQALLGFPDSGVWHSIHRLRFGILYSTIHVAGSSDGQRLLVVSRLGIPVLHPAITSAMHALLEQIERELPGGELRLNDFGDIEFTFAISLTETAPEDDVSIANKLLTRVFADVQERIGHLVLVC